MSKNVKSHRQRVQRQLEFYLSASNLRQDKFLQQHIDEHGFFPATLFLTFNRMKMLHATEQMILDAASKSTQIQVDAEHKSIAPVEMPEDHDDDSDDRSMYVEGFGLEHEHDSLRRLFSKFGKVNLVSMPRFQHTRKFKGFAFVEFASAEAMQAAVQAVDAAQDELLQGFRAMSKMNWLELKAKLKQQLELTATQELKPAATGDAQATKHSAEKLQSNDDEEITAETKPNKKQKTTHEPSK